MNQDMPSLDGTTLSPGPFVIVGDVMVDHIAPLTGPLTIGRDNPTHGTRLTGGQAANTAAWLANTDQTVHEPIPTPRSVHLVAAVGNDDAATFVEREMARANVRCWFERVNEATGQCFIAVTPDGDRTMFPDPGANLHLTTSHVERTLDAIADPSASNQRGHVHLSGYLVARVPECATFAIGYAQRCGWSVSMDTSALVLTTRQQESLFELLTGCHVFFANRTELEALTVNPDTPQESPETLVMAFRDRSRFGGTVVIKDGGQGAYATTLHGLVREPAKQTQVVDTTGAGDAFVAGFLASWCTGDSASVERALRIGNATAASSVAHMGAGPLPYSPAVAQKKDR